MNLTESKSMSALTLPFLQRESSLLRTTAIEFKRCHVHFLLSVLRDHLGLAPPEPLQNLAASCERAIEQLGVGRNYVCTVDVALLPVLKRCVLEYRRRRATEIDELRSRATSLEILADLDKQMDCLDKLLLEEWCVRAEAVRRPRLLDFVTRKVAEDSAAKFGESPTLPVRSFDSKSGVLSPSSSLGPDLKYWRYQCDEREVGLAIAYFDIDDFKRDFNIHTETVVDRNCLPVIMREIEAHCFFHAMPYHEGGDEFVILLPNVDEGDAIEFMDRLRLRLPRLSFTNIPAKARISTGLVHVPADCPATDYELRLRANEGKRFAKEHGGKNCIVVCSANDKNEGPKVVKSG